MKKAATSLIALLFATALHAAPPANDNRADALSILPELPTGGTLIDATKEENEILPDHAGKSVWYRWSPTQAGIWEARITANNASALPVVFKEQPDGSLAKIAAAAFSQSEFTEDTPSGQYPRSKAARFRTAGDEKLFVQVHDFGNPSTFQLQITPHQITAPGNDFANAPTLPTIVTKEVIEINSALRDLAEPPHRLQASVWRKWTSPKGGKHAFRITGLGGSASIEVWRGNTLETLTSAVIANRYGTLDPQVINSHTIAETTPGEQVYLRILADDDLEKEITIENVVKGDLFSDPLDWGSTAEISHTRSLDTQMSLDLNEPSAPGGTQWFRWTAPQDGVYEILGHSPGQSWGSIYSYGAQPFANVYQGNDLATLQAIPKIAVGINQDRYRFLARSGETYHIRAGAGPSRGYYQNDSDLSLSSFLITPTTLTTSLRFLGTSPSNDNFSTPHDFGSAENGFVNATNAGASFEENEAFHLYQARDSTWHRWTAPASGDYEFLFESDHQLEITLSHGTEINTLTPIQGGEILPNQHIHVATVRMRFTAAENQVHYLRIVGGGYGAQGDYSLRLTKLNRPLNDNLANAIDLGNTIPAHSASDTTHGGFEDWEGYQNNRDSSTLWWLWTAPADGFYEVKSNATIGLLEGSELREHLIDSGHQRLRFLATQGRQYRLRLIHRWYQEGPVTLSLDRITGLEHSTPETAIPVGNHMRFSTPPVTINHGGFINEGKKQSSAAWYEWTPQNSGWVRIDGDGSDHPPILQIYEKGSPANVIVQQYPRSYGSESQYQNYHTRYNPSIIALRGFLDNRILVSPTLAPPSLNQFFQVTAGQTYHLVAIPQTPTGEEAPETSTVQLKVQPAAAPPRLDQSSVTYELSPNGGFLTVTLSLTSPNRFSYGSFSLRSGKAAFTSEHRISGDAFAGRYRITLPLASITTPFTINPSVTLHDSLRASWTETLAPHELQPTLPSETPIDTHGPTFKGLTGGPLEIQASENKTTITLELAISDPGGSGFSEGEIYLPNHLNPSQITSISSNQTLPPSEKLADFTDQLAAVKFNARQRIRGDDQLGFYRVEVPIPPHAPAGKLILKMRDRAENLGGTWYGPPTGSFAVTTYRYLTQTLIPVSIVLPNEHERSPVTLNNSSATVIDDTIQCRAELSHPIGVTHGQIILSDANGVILNAKLFSSSDLIAGDEKNGQYQVTLPIPQTDLASAGPHWLAWQTMAHDGSVTTHPMTHEVSLPNRFQNDARLPHLTRFSLSPTQLDLSTGPAEIAISLAAHDDSAGLTAELRITDGHGLPITTHLFVCDLSQLDCTTTITLPQLPLTFTKEARLELTLRDQAGRQITYGTPQSPPWPDGNTPSLTLFPSQLSHFTHWQNQWSASTDENADSDHDGWSNLMEYAFGTDPNVHTNHDPLATQPINFHLDQNVFTNTGLARLMRITFPIAPWFISEENQILSPEKEIIVESSTNLQDWDEVPFLYGISDPAQRLSTHKELPQNAPKGWMRIRIKNRK